MADLDFYRPLTLQQAIDRTGLTLPSNFNSFPSDVQAYIKLRIISAAINNDNGTAMFTAEKHSVWPMLGGGVNFGSSFPYWNYGTTHYYCGSRIGLRGYARAKYCADTFGDYWSELIEENNTSMSLPSNIDSLMPDVQAYIRLRISAKNLNGANGGGTYFPCFLLSSGIPDDIVGIRQRSGGETAYLNRIQNCNWSFLSVIESDCSLTNIGLQRENLVYYEDYEDDEVVKGGSAIENLTLWKKLVGVVT